MRLGRIDEAEPLIRRPLQVWSQTLDEDAPEILFSRLGLAELHIRAGRFDQAREMLARMVPESGWNSPLLASDHRAIEAKLAQRSGDFALAVEYWGEVVEATAEQTGAESVSTARTRVLLAESLLGTGDMAEAERQIALAEPVMRELLLPEAEHLQRMDEVLGIIARGGERGN